MRKKFSGKYEVILETAIQRYQQGGFLVGDLVQIKKNALSHEKLKGISEPMKQRIKEMQESGVNLRLSAIKSKRANTALGYIGGPDAPADYYVDVVQEINPANWVNPTTLPIEVIERLDHESWEPIPVPNSLKRMSPEKTEFDKKGISKDEIGTDEYSRMSKNLNLPTKNTKLANTKKWDDESPGGGNTKKLKKLKEQNDVNMLSEAYTNMYKIDPNVVKRYNELIKLYESGQITNEQIQELQQLDEALPIALGGLAGAGYLSSKALGGLERGIKKTMSGLGGMATGKGFSGGVQQYNVSNVAMPSFQNAFASIEKLKQLGINVPKELNDQLNTSMQQAATQYNIQAPQITTNSTTTPSTSGTNAPTNPSEQISSTEPTKASSTQPTESPQQPQSYTPQSDKLINTRNVEAYGNKQTINTYQRTMPDGTTVNYNAPKPLGPNDQITPNMISKSQGNS